MIMIKNSYLKLFQLLWWFYVFLLITFGVVTLWINSNHATPLERSIATSQIGKLCTYSLSISQLDCQTAITSSYSLLPHALFDQVKVEVGVLTANRGKAITTYASDKTAIEKNILSDVDGLLINSDYILRSINKIYHKFEQII